MKLQKNSKHAGYLLVASAVTASVWGQARIDGNNAFDPLPSGRLEANGFVPPPPSDAPLTRPTPGVASVLSDPLQFGPFRVRPHLDYSLSYATDISTAPGEREDTVVQTVSPGISIEGHRITLDYTPSWTSYPKGDLDSHLDHRASLQAGFSYSEWVFGLTHSYGKSGGVTTETATQVDRDSHATSISASRPLSERFSLSLTANQDLLFADEFNSSRQWSTMEWLNYLYSEKTTLGLGAGFGYADVDSGSDMTYEQVMGRVTWNPGVKLSVLVSGGVEIRQFLDADISDRVNPLMSVGASYQLFEQTSVSLAANHTVNTSLIGGQITENTTVTAALSQRLFGHVNVRVSGGYRYAEYQPTVDDLTVDRTDDGYFAGVSAGIRVFERGRISIAYNRTENSSSDSDFSYGSNQYSLHLGYHF